MIRGLRSEWLAEAGCWAGCPAAAILSASATFVLAGRLGMMCSWLRNGQSAQRITKKLTRAASQTSSMELDGHRGVECSDLVKHLKAFFPVRSVHLHRDKFQRSRSRGKPHDIFGNLRNWKTPPCQLDEKDCQLLAGRAPSVPRGSSDRVAWWKYS